MDTHEEAQPQFPKPIERNRNNGNSLTSQPSMPNLEPMTSEDDTEVSPTMLRLPEQLLRTIHAHTQPKTNPDFKELLN